MNVIKQTGPCPKLLGPHEWTDGLVRVDTGEPGEPMVMSRVCKACGVSAMELAVQAART